MVKQLAINILSMEMTTSFQYQNKSSVLVQGLPFKVGLQRAACMSPIFSLGIRMHLKSEGYKMSVGKVQYVVCVFISYFIHAYPCLA